jgi:N-methylhydantoinase A
VAGPLGCSVEEAAFDCWRVVNATMTQAVRRSTADKGTDPRELALLAYGGNGPVFAGIQAEELGIERVWVPRTSPAFSALGTLAARPGLDEERSLLAPLAEAPSERLRELWAELAERATHHLGEAGHPPGDVHYRFRANVRYPGQNWSLAVDAAEVVGDPALDFVSDALRGELVERFHALHRAEYGHDRPAEPPELTGVRLQTWVQVPQPAVGSGGSAARRDAEPRTRRRAHLGYGFAETPVHRGAELAPGHTVTGPAIIEETFTTIVVYPGWEATVDDAGDYRMVRTSSGSGRRPIRP